MEDAEALPSAFPTTLVPPTTQSLRRSMSACASLKTQRFRESSSATSAGVFFKAAVVV